jgi:hypothetical protein
MRGIKLLLLAILDFAVFMYDRHMTGNLVLVWTLLDSIS